MCNTLRREGGGMAGLAGRVDRSPSPLPQIQRALFQAGVSPLSPVSGRRSSKRSLEEDIRSVAEDKENLPEGEPAGRRRRSSGRGLAARDANVFRFPSTAAACGVAVHVEAPEEDEVFATTPLLCPLSYPTSSRLLLTPSTARTPLHLPSIDSPALERGLCCATPNRRRLEEEGLKGGNTVLGRGAFGTVVLGRWRGRKVAVKVLEAEAGGTTVRRRRSLEGELCARRLEHEHVVRVHAVHAMDGGHALVIMEYVGSRNLHCLLLERRQKVLARAWLLSAAAQVASALQHCHQRGVAHLDVKPANVLVTSGGVCKLGDFGCAVALEEQVEGALGGTPGYQAPELLRGAAPAAAADVYSLGLLLWQLDARELPYPGLHPQAVMFRVVAVGARPAPPATTLASVGLPAFTSLYSRCWAAQPADRPTMATVVASLIGMRPIKTPTTPNCRLRVMR